MHINISSKTTHSQITVNMPSFLSFLLILLNILLLLNGTVQSNDGSTEGFMELSLLEAKTIGTNNNGQTTAGLAESVETRWIITDKQFNCSGSTLTEVLVGVDIRPVTLDRNQYPRIDIWEQSVIFYRRRIRRFRSITLKLSPHNFTTNGLYRYTLPPLNINGFNANYRLGVYQPPDDRSVVRFYKVTGTGQIGLLDRIGRESVERDFEDDDDITLETSRILMYPIMSMSY